MFASSAIGAEVVVDSMIGSAKLAAEAVDVMEIDFDDDFDEDNWDDVQSVLPVSTAVVCFAVCA